MGFVYVGSFDDGGDDSSLSSGAAVGIYVGVVGGALVLSIICIFLCMRIRKKKRENIGKVIDPEEVNSESDGEGPHGSATNEPRSESSQLPHYSENPYDISGILPQYEPPEAPPPTYQPQRNNND